MDPSARVDLRSWNVHFLHEPERGAAAESAVGERAGVQHGAGGGSEEVRGGIRGGDGGRRLCERYGEGMAEAGVVEGNERVEQARTAYGMGERDILLGVHKVYLSQKAFHRIEDKLWAAETEEQKRY
ncbi:hypothetical protein B0H11DRAFT_2262292 [Mycena galericulata]|nr:hypothetical protein B0H11DRAFT_2262292 [Mycena galericulata]